ncbi:MAG: carbohydrate ABC transporter permease [Sphaerochaetaceae bacterium]|nr:carbohydrate ABC transporter permease [Sphaerochaetaceae bacterium]
MAKKRLTWKKVCWNVFFVFSLVFLTSYVLAPLLTMVLTSIKPLEDIQIIEKSLIPDTFDFRTYQRMWKTVPLSKYIVNSIIVVGLSTLFSVIIAIIVGYVMDRFKFLGKKGFGNMLIFAQMLPGILFLLPLYLLFTLVYRQLGIKLVGTYKGLILTYMTFSLPFSIWMMKSYFHSIPKELEEAAYIDGCGYLKTLFRIIYPVARPGVIAVAIYSFFVGWEEIMFASVLTNDMTRTISVGLRTYAAAEIVYWNEMMAAAVTVTLPVIIVFLFLQKYLVQGLTAGGVKE